MGAVTLQLVDKENRDVCGLSDIDPCPNCRLTSAESSRMLPHCPAWAWLNRSYLAGTVVGWLVPVVQSRVQAGARAERLYRLLSCPTSAAGSSNSSCSSWTARGIPGSRAVSRRSSNLAAHCSSSNKAATEQLQMRGSLQQQQQQQQQRTKGHIYCT